MHPPVRALRPTLWPPVAAAPLLLLLLIPSAGHAATASQRIAATATAADLDPSAPPAQARLLARARGRPVRPADP